MDASVPENVYQGELVAYPGPYAFEIGRSSVILVSDDELDMLADPDKVLNLSLTFDKYEASLRQICENSRNAGQRTLIIAFDHFFKQYRPGQDNPRRLTPDMDEYIQKIAKIGAFAQQYGLGLELSLLSPLEVGPGFAAQTGDSGMWMHYREGVRDPKTGAYCVQYWQQRQWCNNKGPVAIKDAGVRVFAFHENTLGETPYRVVNPDEIVEITDTAELVPMEGTEKRQGDYISCRVMVRGVGHPELTNLDRIFVVQQYKTPEMDYFSPQALPFLKGMVDKYADAGVKLNGLYSDEMHIQQDWGYFSHHDNGELALRYVTDNLGAEYAKRFGEQYRDFAKYMIYFAYGQEDFASDLTAKAGNMHVFGPKPEQINETALFRARYYHLLQDEVVKLFTTAKKHAEQRMGHKLESRAHATWAESPTIDKWFNPGRNPYVANYEYTSNFVWSNTVHQAAAACYDYFQWGDFLTGNGNDHCECGWLDRNYTGCQLACSTGILNDVPYSYAAHWGMPGDISHRRYLVASCFGTTGAMFGAVQNTQHRDVDVLMLYPLDLVAVEERFGSWMCQYPYANLISPAKMLEEGRVVNGAVEVRGRRFTTLVATFEPFPSEKLLGMMKDLLASGGRVIWSGPPPVLTLEGTDALTPWKDLFGVEYKPEREFGYVAAGRRVNFSGDLAGVNPQTILTHYLVDRVYPVQPREDVESVAHTGKWIIGTLRKFDNGATATFLGYRPRDDQSGSLGYDERNWFEVLYALGAYPASGKFTDINDNTEVISRTSELLACRFPNGSISICNHLRAVEEDWEGGFARDAARDAEVMKRVVVPSYDLELIDFKVDGHVVSFDGNQFLGFNTDAENNLVAFVGMHCDRVMIDGRTTIFADQKMPLVSWASVPQERQINSGAVMQVRVHGEGTVRIPANNLPAAVEVIAEGALAGSRGAIQESQMENGVLVIKVDAQGSNRWLWVVPK